MAIEEGQSSGNLNAQVSGYDLFIFPQFYVALSLFVSVALSCRFNSCVVSVLVGLFDRFTIYLLSVPAMFKFCVYAFVLQFYCFASICLSVSVHLFIYFDCYIMFGTVTESYIPCHVLMFDMLYGSCLHVVMMIHVMLIFINNIIYVVDIWERNKELIRKRTDIGEHFTREVIQSIVFIFFTTRRKSASD